MDYDTLIAQQNKTNDSLSARLDEIARQNDAQDVTGMKYLDNLPQADLYNKNNSVLAGLALKTQSATFTKAQQDKYDTGMKMLADLLSGKTSQGVADENKRHNQMSEAIDLKKLESTGTDTADLEKKLREEYTNQTKTNGFIDVKNSYDKIKNAADTGPGDLGLLYAYMKVLDPNSTVREGEFATAAASGSYGDKMKNYVLRVQSGKRLNPELRKEFQDSAVQVYNSQVKTQKQLNDFYASQAQQQGLDPNNVIGALGEIKEEPITPISQPKKSKSILDILKSPFGSNTSGSSGFTILQVGD